MYFSKSQFSSLVLFIALCLVVSGCSSKKGKKVTISGTVTLDGKPLAYGKIAVSPDSGQNADGDIVDGKFSIPQAPTKVSVKVTVITEHLLKNSDLIRAKNKEIEIDEQSLAMSKQMKKDPGDLKPLEDKIANAKEEVKTLQSQTYTEIPKKYTDVKTTPISETLESGKELTIELTSK